MKKVLIIVALIAVLYLCGNMANTIGLMQQNQMQQQNVGKALDAIGKQADAIGEQAKTIGQQSEVQATLVTRVVEQGQKIENAQTVMIVVLVIVAVVLLFVAIARGRSSG